MGYMHEDSRCIPPLHPVLSHACTVMSAESLASSEEVKQLELRVHEAMGTTPEQGHISFVELHVRLCTRSNLPA